MSNKVNLFVAFVSLLLSCLLLICKIKIGTVLSAFTTSSPTTFLFVGDVMLGRSVNGNIQNLKDATWPFHYVADLLKNVDFTIGNLESPLIPNCPNRRDGMIFCGESSNALGLKNSGFDYVSLANNHSANYGISGLTSTQQTLTKYGITPIAQSQVAFGEKNDTTFAILAFDDVTRALDSAKLTILIKDASTKADIVFVYFHWGQEYLGHSNARQQSLAHQSIEAGASVVLGAHPHVIQESEIYLGKPIYYSLGNFVFDQEWSIPTKNGLAVKFIFQNAKLTTTQELPVKIENYGQPHWQ